MAVYQADRYRCLAELVSSYKADGILQELSLQNFQRRDVFARRCCKPSILIASCDINRW